MNRVSNAATGLAGFAWTFCLALTPGPGGR